MKNFNNKVSFIKTWKKPEDHSITLFKEVGCYFGNADVFKPGYYDIDDLGHVGNDEASGIMIPQDVTVTIFEDPHFAGKSVKIQGPAKICNDFKGLDRNSLSSMIVDYEKPVAIKTEGSWAAQSGTVGGDLSLSLTKTYSSSKGTTLSHSETLSITNSISESLVFESASVSTTFSSATS